MPIGLRADFDAQTTRAAAKPSKDGPQARRLLALAAIYDGSTRTEAAKMGGVTLQILRDCVVKFNSGGPDDLIDRKAPGACRHHRERTDSGDPWGRALADHRSFASGCSRSSGSRSPSKRSAGNCGPWAIASSRLVRSIMRRPRAQSRILKNVPRRVAEIAEEEGVDPGSIEIWFAPTRRASARRTRSPAAGPSAERAPLAARPTHRLNLHIRRDPPERGQRRGARPARL